MKAIPHIYMHTIFRTPKMKTVEFTDVLMLNCPCLFYALLNSTFFVLPLFVLHFAVLRPS